MKFLAPELRLIGQTIAHFEILGKLGEGGMGVVYKAHDTKLDRFVALKFLPPGLLRDSDAKDRFIQEAKAASALDHPNICTIYEIGEAEAGQLFIAMAFYDGDTLRARIGKGGSSPDGSPADGQGLPLEEAVRIGIEIARGLQKAHEKGIVHRDIKPANIIITNDGTAKILDFGLAKLAGQGGVTRTGSTMGTPAYMSPEQARGEDVDQRTDVWSLGVTLYEALAGRPAFQGHYESAMIYLILHEDPESLRTLRADVPPGLESIIRKALQKDRNKRHENVTQLIAELESFRAESMRGESARTAGETSTRKSFESERRQVTVLFASITGHESFGENFDSEMLTTALSDCFKGLLSIIRKYEGTTDRFVGEKAMAIFGAPIAHENDPERAVRCSLDMRSYMERFNSIGAVQLPGSLRITIGIHSGMVIAGSVGTGTDSGYSVIGDTVNLTAGILDCSPVGSIYLSGEACKLVSTIVEVDQARPNTIKGKSQPVEMYPLKGLKPGVELGRRSIGTGAFVGRKKELEAIETSLGRTVEKHSSRLFVRGEPGVGKSRLKEEMIDRARKKGMAICEGKCSSFELNTPYFLWNTFLKSLLRIDTETAENEVKMRLHDTLQILSLEHEEAYLATLLSLRYEEILFEVDADRKRRIYEAARKLLKAFAVRRPCLFIFEDLHWIDRFSQELLDFVFEQETSGPAMFCCLFRPEYRQTDRFIKPEELLDLDRLPPDDAKALIRSRLGVEKIPVALEELVHKRAEGNPFFIEEIVKTLLDKNIISVRKGTLDMLSSNVEAGVPETLQGVILSRIDQLEERIREVLLDASVIGREFSRPVLEHVVQKKIDVSSGLRKLEELELVLEREEAREFAYLFKHYLIQEVAYNTILQKKRKELHALIARAIETLYAEKLKEFYELLAFHYERAEEWQKAADYLSRAGNKVREIYTSEESKDFFERKEAAKSKLLEARGVRNRMMIVYRIVFGVFALLYFGGLVAFLVEYAKKKVPDSPIVIALVVVLAILYALGGVWFTFKMFQPLRSRPTLFELFEDRIELMFDNGISYAIPFGEIFLVHYFLRPLKASGVTLWRWLSANMKGANSDYGVSIVSNMVSAAETISPYSFGFGSKKGEIHIRKKTGASFVSKESQMRPWKVGYVHERDIAITPAEPKEFYDQLAVALEKWKRVHEPSKPIVHPEFPAGLPIVTVHPVFRTFPSLFSLSLLAYLIFAEALQFISMIIIMMSSEKPTSFDFVPPSLATLATIAAFFWFVKMKRDQRSNVYEFYHDRLVYSVRRMNPSRGSIFYESIVRVDLTGKRYRKVFHIGDLIVRTRSILRTHPATNIAVTGLLIPDIEKPEEILEKIDGLLESFRKKYSTSIAESGMTVHQR